MTIAIQVDTNLVLAIEAAIVGSGGGGGLACTLDWAAWDVDSTFRDPDVSANLGAIFRKSVSRVGFTDSSAWAMTQGCVPFQHVASRTPQVIADGMLVPAQSANLFRFPANLDLEPEDAVLWRMGARARTVWVVTETSGPVQPLAKVVIADVERLLDVETALRDLLPV